MKNEIENIFKQKFENFEAAPSAGLFDAIVAKRAKKKRAVWIWSAAAVITALSVFGLWSVNSKNKSTGIVQSNTELSIDNKLPQKNRAPQAPKQNELSTAEMNELPQTSITAEDAPKIDTQKRTILNEDERAISPEQAHPPKLNKAKLASKTSNKDGVSEKNVVGKNEWAQLFAQIEKENPDKDITKGTLFLGNKKQTVDKSPELNNSGEKTPTLSDESSTPTPKSVESEEDNIVTVVSSEDDDQAPLPLPTGKLVALGKWRIQSTAGLGYASRTLAAADQEYIDLRNNTEKAALSYQLGIDVIYQFAPKWNIQTGLQYTLRKEQFKHGSITYTVVDKEVQRTETVIHPVLGEIERTYTEIVKDTTDQNNKMTTMDNRFVSVNVPIVLEREIYATKKWSLLAKAGVLAGIYSDRSGLLMSTQNNVQEYVALPTRKAGINSAIVGLGMQYRLTPRVSLLAYPQANIQLNSSTTSEAGFMQKDWGIYTHFGLRIGL